YAPRLPRHLRRPPEQDVHRHVDRNVVDADARVAHDELALRGELADDGIRAALALAEPLEDREIRGLDRQHVALLRLVRPELHRAHAGLVARHAREIDDRAAARVVDDLGHGVREAAGADVVDRRDRVLLAERPARIDDFLRAALHLGIAALHRREIERLLAFAGLLRRRGAAAETDQHRRPAEHDELRARAGLALLDLHGAHVADAPRDHDRLVIAAPFAVGLEQARAEIAREARPAVLVIELRRADRTLDHDRERRRDPSRPPRAARFPRLLPARNLEMRHREADEPGLRSSA